MLITTGHNKWVKLLHRFCLLLITFHLTACAQSTQMPASTQVRLAVVNTPQDSGLLTYLLAEFEAQTGHQVIVEKSDDPFAIALAGNADMIISHYGKAGMAEFVADGYGSWPNMVFANQAALIGPKNDPARVGDSSSLAEAFRAIANNGQTLIANNNGGISALTELVSTASGLSLDSDWYRDLGVSKGRAIKVAEKEHAYVIWGAIPFLTFQAKHHTEMAILFSADPLLQRIMAITRPKPEHFPATNTKAAKILETYLLSTATQTKIMRFRAAGSDHQLWWPAGRHN
ncbi:hypothetical protein [Methylophaga thiooxydans]|nr:hypothetical protein [Methylophaga thiooxydans]